MGRSGASASFQAGCGHVVQCFRGLKRWHETSFSGSQRGTIIVWEQEFLDELSAYVGFTEAHAALLKDLSPILAPDYGAIVERFYEAISRVPGAAAVFTGGAPQIERQKALLLGWLAGLCSGQYDVDYIKLRARIGRTHVRIRLPQRYMFASMNLVREGLHHALERSTFGLEDPSAVPDRSRAHPAPERRLLAHSAIDKICDLELAIMLETYSEDYSARIRDQERLTTLGKLAGSVEACIVGLDGEGFVRFCNRFAHERLANDGELVGRCLSAACHEKDQRTLARAIELAVGAEHVRDVDCRIKVDGRMRTIRWTIAPLGLYEDSLDLTVLATGIDITERLALEHKTAEAEAMATMGVLTTGLAHEIRNPLNAAKLQLELLIRRARRATVDDVQDQLVEPAKLVKTEIDRLSSLLDEFLYLARPRPMERRLCLVSELFTSVCELEEPVARSAGVSLRTRVMPSDLQVRADPDKLKQVLINLVTNAVDAVREHGGGKVELLAEPSAEGGVIISVADDGVGIPEDVAETAFKPFVTSKPAGTGLGLAIVQKIVAQHGGTAELVTRPSGGTLARFQVSA
jgi:signal transduction histidine kinase